jgi:hypothetical protein
MVNGLDDRVGPGNADVEYRHDVAIPTNRVDNKGGRRHDLSRLAVAALHDIEGSTGHYRLN